MAAPMASARYVLTGLRNIRSMRLMQCHHIGRLYFSHPVVGSTVPISRCLCSGHSKSGSENDEHRVVTDKEDSSTSEEKPKIKLQLAKPKGQRRLGKTSSEDVLRDSDSSDSSSSSSSSSSSESSDSSDDEGQPGQVKPDMVKAAKAVAKALGGNVQKTESDLLSQLKKHQELTDAQKDGAVPEKTTESLKDIFSGMKIQRERPSQSSFQREPRGKPRFIDKQGSRKPFQRKRASGAPDVKLYDGPALGIFTTKQGNEVARTGDRDLFSMVEEEEFAKSCTFPPPNAFEEMIQWTRQGKLWRFPIDNEQGMDEEAEVGFHEHVFLDHLLTHFPEKGPVRIFMELVLIGLSKNPYLTVQQKHEHVMWFKDYFDEKRHILEELMKAAQKESQKEIES